ncbi:hypothetical protein [Amycolatopsis sp. NPDC051071]|uniref:hypothetical protein n=1 Tax=Amycolatopsis sp. NPDC051071 TaxID=3154637 RepID=UPI0034496631
MTLEEPQIEVLSKHSFRIAFGDEAPTDNVRWKGRGPLGRVVAGNPKSKNPTHATLLARWFRSTTFDEAAAALDRQRILWQRYRTFEELGRGALRDLDLFGEIDQPGIGTWPRSRRSSSTAAASLPSRRRRSASTTPNCCSAFSVIRR